MNYWLGGAYTTRDKLGNMSKKFIENNVYAIDFEMRDLSDKIVDTAKFKIFLSELEAGAKKAFECLSQIKTGDKIAIKSSVYGEKGVPRKIRIMAIGTVLSSLQEGYNFNKELGHTIPVEWEKIFKPAEYKLKGYTWTLHKVTDEQDIAMIFNTSLLPDADISGKNSIHAWWPSENDYHPGIDAKKWASLLTDENVFTVDAINIVSRLLAYEDGATCKQLSHQYGETNNYYNSGSSALARRVWKTTNCAVLELNNENSKWWPILYVGRPAERDDEGSYIWKLRTELREALISAGVTVPESHPAANTYSAYSKEDFLSEVYMTSEKYDDIKTVLDRKKNIILQGAPGVGKSFLAKRLAYSIIGLKDVSKVEMVQFHQSYSYEDFIEGYRPDGEGSFVLKHGVFYSFCESAKKNKENHYFIIDEINRGNLSKIMGELMLLIESDKRGAEFAMPLTYSGTPFFVPENVYIIGLMNTADRSLAMIDYALRRRFSFIQIEPAFGNTDFIKYIKKGDEKLGKRILDEMTSLNVDIKNDLGAGFQIGHSYFCNCDNIDEQWYESVLRYEILPLLDEYWFDNEKQHSKWVKRLLYDEKNPN